MGILELYSELGSFTKVANRLGISRQAATAKIKRELAKHPTVYPSSKQPILSPDKPVRVLYFTDAHNQPDMAQDRFIWLARLCNELKPDILIDGGDTQDFLSLCSHEKNESYKGKLKPSLAKDLECAAQMYALLNRHLTHKCRKIVTLGNHEHRLWVYENDNPEMYGIPTAIYTKDILEASGWEWYKYGEYVDINGVQFTHCPFNGMGKPVGGDNACKQIAEKSLHDTVFGHTHYFQIVTAHKFGSGEAVTAFNAGCYMPNNYVPTYAKNTRKKFWYGAHLITISDRKIDSIKSWSINEMERDYG